MGWELALQFVLKSILSEFLLQFLGPWNRFGGTFGVRMEKPTVCAGPVWLLIIQSSQKSLYKQDSSSAVI
eukprot:1513801-Amphidinium_carterae.1